MGNEIALPWHVSHIDYSWSHDGWSLEVTRAVFEREREKQGQVTQAVRVKVTHFTLHVLVLLARSCIDTFLTHPHFIPHPSQIIWPVFQPFFYSSLFSLSLSLSLTAFTLIRGGSEWRFSPLSTSSVAHFLYWRLQAPFVIFVCLYFPPLALLSITRQIHFLWPNTHDPNDRQHTWRVLLFITSHSLLVAYLTFLSLSP